MSYSPNGSSSSIHGSTDVSLNNPVSNDLLTYQANLQLWTNTPGPVLTATTLQTASNSPITATANTLMPCDANSGAITVNLPPAPPDKTRLVIKKIDSSTNTISIASGGSDVFNKLSGLTSLTLSLTNQAVSLQYAATNSIWYVLGDDLPLASLDGRYNAAYAEIPRTGTRAVGQGETVANVKDFGAFGDAVLLGDGVVTSGSLSTLTSSSANFTVADVGKTILIYNTVSASLNDATGTTIASVVNTTTVTLATSVTIPASGVYVIYGAHDDTAAIQAALNSTTTSKVFIPNGLYLVSALTVPTGREIIADERMSYTGIPSSGGRIVCLNPAQTTPLLSLTSYSHVSGLCVVGSSVNHDAIFITSGRCTLTNLTTIRGKSGINYNYTGVNYTLGCQIHENNTGIRNPVDSIFEGCYVNVQLGDGVSQQAGSNDCVFKGMKIEFNNGHGINNYSNTHNNYALMVIDRNGQAGIRSVSCSLSSYSLIMLRRNGSLSQGTQDEDTHMYLQGNTDISFNQIMTQSGTNDDGSGYDSPLGTIVRQDGVDLTFVASQLDGCTSTTPDTAITSCTNLQYIACSGLPGVPTLTGRAQIGSTSTVTIANTAATSTTFTVNAIATYNPGQFYRLELLSRDTVSTTRYLADAYVLTQREGGNASVTVVGVENKVGTQIGTTPGTGIAISATCATDGSTVTITVTNNLTNAQQVRFVLS